jgi:hypothetical protein
MVTPTKITLSPQELQLVTDPGWILTKRSIIDKVYGLLGDVAERMKCLAASEKDGLPQKVIASEAKIYKGENYRLLPYVLLDYPRCFNGADAFAIRTLFWWGNFFSITLHLGGQYKKMFEGSISKKLPVLQQDNYYVCINEDQWQHHFEADNYIAAKELDEERFMPLIHNGAFIKLSLQFSLQRWDEMPGLLERSFFSMLQLLRS